QVATRRGERGGDAQVVVQEDVAPIRRHLRRGGDGIFQTHLLANSRVMETALFRHPPLFWRKAATLRVQFNPSKTVVTPCMQTHETARPLRARPADAWVPSTHR